MSLTSTQSILILGLGLALLIAIVLLCYFSWFFCYFSKGEGVLAAQATYNEEEEEETPSDNGTMAVQYDDIYHHTPYEEDASDLEEGIEFTEDNPALYLEMPKSYVVKDMEIVW